MRRYLATLHTKPDHHKRRFALLVSGSFTAFMFVIWSLVNFGLPREKPSVVAKAEPEEIGSSPFSNIKDGFAAAFKALGGGFDEVKKGLEQVEFDSEYQEMRDRAFETYGR